MGAEWNRYLECRSNAGGAREKKSKKKKLRECRVHGRVRSKKKGDGYEFRSVLGKRFDMGKCQNDEREKM